MVGMPPFLRQLTPAVSTAATEFHTQFFPLFFVSAIKASLQEQIYGFSKRTSVLKSARSEQRQYR